MKIQTNLPVGEQQLPEVVHSLWTPVAAAPASTNPRSARIPLVAADYRLTGIRMMVLSASGLDRFGSPM
jgi:hypothetical protein